MVNNFYDLQRLRLQSEGRHNRSTGPATQLDERDTLLMKAHSDTLTKLEDGIEAEIRPLLRAMPFYQEYLKNFNGVGVVGAAAILSQFDIKLADTASKMWAFAGLRPLPCRRCRKCQQPVEAFGDMFKHTMKMSPSKKSKFAPKNPPAPRCDDSMVTVSDTYESGKAQKPTRGEKLPYNAWLRAKLLGGIGSAVIKNQTQPWIKVYEDYKHRKLTQGWGMSDGHRHNAAMRYMVKMMLLEIWTAWRKFEGLDVRPSYHEEKQGHVHARAV